jgi:superfamily II DNA/RNA helicase
MSPSFADLGVPSDLVAALARRSIFDPFPIQAATLPDALAGRDLCGKAPTGSGKTLAFGIAAVARLGSAPAASKRPHVLVLTPTRELCSQVASELSTLASARGKRVASFYGGVGYDRQIKGLARGIDIAVACPGRLADLMNGGHIRLDAARIVIVDEADRMADMGFLPEVRRILDKTPDDRQTMLFSATLDGDVDVLVRRYQRNPARHEHAETAEDVSHSEHHFWRVESTARVDVAAEIVAASGRTIVFCRTRHSTDRTARQLVARGVRAVTIHGDRSQAQRERALASFADGHAGALVATDVAARGIHVDDVAVVVHFDPPADAKDYVHRSGRTARAGATGVVVSFVTPDKTKAVRQLQRDLGVTGGIVAPDISVLPRGTAPQPVKRSGRDTPDRPDNVTDLNGAPRNGAPRNGAPRNGAPRNGAQRHGAPGAPRSGAQRHGAPRHGAPRHGAPRHGAPAQRNGAPAQRNGAPAQRNGAPAQRNGAPAQSASGRSSANAASGHSASGNGGRGDGSTRAGSSGDSSTRPFVARQRRPPVHGRKRSPRRSA